MYNSPGTLSPPAVFSRQRLLTSISEANGELQEHTQENRPHTLRTEKEGQLMNRPYKRSPTEWASWTNLFSTLHRMFHLQVHLEGKTMLQKEVLKCFQSQSEWDSDWGSLSFTENHWEKMAEPDWKLVFLPFHTSAGPNDRPLQGTVCSASALILWEEEESCAVTSGYGLQMKNIDLLLEKFWISVKTVEHFAAVFNFFHMNKLLFV